MRGLERAVCQHYIGQAGDWPNRLIVRFGTYKAVLRSCCACTKHTTELQARKPTNRCRAGRSAKRRSPQRGQLRPTLCCGQGGRLWNALKMAISLMSGVSTRATRCAGEGRAVRASESRQRGSPSAAVCKGRELEIGVE